MSVITAVIIIVIVAVITPGPNNFIIMSAAAHGGSKTAIPVGIGVIAGSLLLVSLIWIGAGVLFTVEPRILSILKTTGALYLTYIGMTIIMRANSTVDQNAKGCEMVWPNTFYSVAVFQVINPKSWVLCITAFTALSEEFSAGLSSLLLAIIISMLSVFGLSLWALIGSLMVNSLDDPIKRKWILRILGLLLLMSAASLLKL